MQNLKSNEIAVVHGGQQTGSAPTVSTDGDTVTVSCPAGTEPVLVASESGASVFCAASQTAD